MLVDYERAYHELIAALGERPNWGRDQIRARAATVLAECHVPESEPERAFRLYGVQLHEDLRAAARDERVAQPPGTGHDGPNHGGRSSSAAMAPLPGDHSPDDLGGRHDGRSTPPDTAAERRARQAAA